MKTILNVKNHIAELPADIRTIICVEHNGYEIPSININYLSIAQMNYWEKDIPSWAIREDCIYFSSRKLSIWERIRNFFKINKEDVFTINYVSENEHKFWDKSNSELYDAVNRGVLKVSEMIFIMDNNPKK